MDWQTKASSPDLSPRGFARVVVITVAGVFISMAVAVLAVSYTTQFMDELPRLLTWIAAVTIPIFMSGPMFFFIAMKLRELAIAHHELSIFASQDSLTTVLNRGAFITLVDAYLSQVNLPPEGEGGLLMIDADHFKTINDRYGHAVGDDALRIIADAIKSAVRSTDLVGRVGGEEFAVFLPRSDRLRVSHMAERIRESVSQARFAPLGEQDGLSVSVGGAVYRGTVPFEQLFAAADRHLYEAKARGRDRAIVDPRVLIAA
jgi:diguanylate cyclase (GGDEF)-like protein